MPKVCLKRKKCYCYGDEDVSFNSSSLFNPLSDKSFSFSRKNTLLFSMINLSCSIIVQTNKRFEKKLLKKSIYIIPLK